jgi:predicted DNA-binding transcriptional regulator AlpA
MPTLSSKPTNSISPATQRRSASSSPHPRHEAIDEEARLITESQVADRLTLSVKTLRNWRLTGYGPPHLKVGRLVRYSVSGLKVWLKSCERASTSDRGTIRKSRVT